MGSLEEKKKAGIGEWLEETRCKLPRVSSQQSHTGCIKFLQQGFIITNVKCPLGKLIRDSVPNVLTGGWSRRHTLPCTYQNSRLLEGKQAFGINHIICTNSLGIVSYHFVNGENPPEIKVPRRQLQTTLQRRPF